jgi:hypothetical protein
MSSNEASGEAFSSEARFTNGPILLVTINGYPVRETTPGVSERFDSGG